MTRLEWVLTLTIVVLLVGVMPIVYRAGGMAMMIRCIEDVRSITAQ